MVDIAGAISSRSKDGVSVALVHEWLDTFGGSETVLAELIREFPNASIYALVDFMREPQRNFLEGRRVHTSFLQSLPGAASRFRMLLPLMPLAVEQMDLTGYDVVISSSHAVAKGVLTAPDQLHIAYVHSPMRYAWDLQHQYLHQRNLERGLRSWVARSTLHYLRLWDARTANGVDSFFANSQFIARRIMKAYRRRSEVVYPPVDVDRFPLHEKKEEYYLTTSRLVPYKRVDLIVEAFGQLMDRRLVVVGNGPELAAIQKRASPNVDFLGYQEIPDLVSLTQRARAFVFAALEDFGISVVEAQAAGTPVIAYGRGGARETVVGLPNENPTGVLFNEQSVEAIVDAVRQFETHEQLFDACAIRSNALRFSRTSFHEAFKQAYERARAAFYG